jgi:hypothetical protein
VDGRKMVDGREMSSGPCFGEKRSFSIRNEPTGAFVADPFLGKEKNHEQLAGGITV